MTLFLVIVLATSPVWAQAPAAPVILPAPGGSAPSPSTTPQLPPGKTQFAGSGKAEAPATGPITACAPGPTQAQCLQKLAKAQSGQGNQGGGMEKAMPILNAVSQMLGGGEPADGGSERMAAGWDSGGGGYSSSGSTTSAGELVATGPRGTAAVVPVFNQYFEKCTTQVGMGKCRFRFDGTWGDAAHQRRRSCHNLGYAIDVGLPYVCEKGSVNRGSQAAVAIAHCLAENTDGNLKTIFQIPRTPNGNCDREGWTNITGPNMYTSKLNHCDHIHVQLAKCPY